MELFFGLAAGAVIVEGVITYARTFFTRGKVQWPMLVAVGLGCAVAVVYDLNLFEMLGVQAVIPYASWLGNALTGVLIARGSNYMFDLVQTLTRQKEDALG